MLLKDIKKNLVFVFKMFAAVLPCIVLLMVQYTVSFYLSSASDGGVEIAWLAVWKVWSPNVLLSLLLSMAFPVYYYIVFANRREGHGTGDRLAGCTFLCGLLEYAILAETGERRYHGNFMWGLQLAAFLIYFVSVRKFYVLNAAYDYNDRRERRKISAGWIILLFQVYFGVHYIIQLLFVEGKVY